MVSDDEKQRRMEIRRELGNREVGPKEPPPDGPEYLIPFACFSCRKSFKQTIASEDEKRICPECEARIYDVGRNFRPPPQKNKKAWQAAKMLYEAGFHFSGSGSHDAPPLPEDPKLIEQFLEDYPDHPLRVRKRKD